MIVYTPSKYYTPEIESDRLSQLSPIILRAMRARGITTEAERNSFLYPDISMLHDPFLLSDMQKAVERIEEAIFSGEKICVYGDYDVDGICATTMLLQYLLSIGAEAVYRIPSRQEDGYGISRGAIDKLNEIGISLIITVDNGISAYSEIEYAATLGVDVIVTDHHIPPERTPDCVAVVCHSVEGSQYPNRYLCGAGTAFKLIQAIGGLDSAMPFVTLAGVATIADVVPLLDENRVFVRYALDAMNQGDCCPGLSTLLQSIPSAKKPYNTCNIGFGVAPRLNASGRMGDASLGVELFMTDDQERIAAIIAELGRLNEMRQAEEQSILDSAIDMVGEMDLSKQRSILLASEKWNSGVIGIAASRLTELYHRPAILFSEANGVLKGSARSVEGINIHDALKAHADMFIRFGGHAKAAGVTMEKENFGRFSDAFNAYLEKECAPELFVPRRGYEFDEDVSCITLELARQLELLAPFGEANPAPVFHASSMLPSRMRRFGSDGQHLRMDLRQNRFSFESVYFCGGKNFDRIISADSISLLYSPFINSWNGTDMVQLRVLSAKPDLPRCPMRMLKANIHHFYSAFLHGIVYNEQCRQQPQLYSGGVAEIMRGSFAGLILIASSLEGAETTLRELAHSQVENFEVCFGVVPSAGCCSNTLLIAPQFDNLPEKGYNTVLLCDEPYAQGCINEIINQMPHVKLLTTGMRCDFSEICGGFSISRDEFGIYYRKIQQLLGTRTFSMPELGMKLSDSLSRPPHQTEFVLKVFCELGFISANGGAVTLQRTGHKCLDESMVYKTVAAIQQNE